MTSFPESLEQEDFDRVLKLVRRRIYPPLDAENITGDILYECYQRKIHPSYSLIRNRCYDALRRSRREQHCDLEGLYRVLSRTTEQSADRAVDLGETHRIVHQLVERADLSPEEQRILYQRYYQEYTFEEIATRLGMKLYKVTLCHQALISKLQLTGASLES